MLPMLVYEEDRTESIVRHLVAVGKLARVPIILIWLIGTSLLVAAGLFMIAPSEVSVLIGVIVGAYVGYELGAIMASILAVVVEWMAQILLVFIIYSFGNQLADYTFVNSEIH